MASYYNEHDPFAAAWLRELIRDGLIADGEVDERDIQDVPPGDLRGFRQCHFFAGIGGWSYALRLAGWPDDRACWTGSCPCQRFSSAARGRTVAADVWPEFRRLITYWRPGDLLGEQVAQAGDWFDGVCADLEALDYAVGAAILPAVAVGADHARPRIYFAGHTDRHGEPGLPVHVEVGRLSRRDREPGGMVSTNGLSRDVVALAGFGNAIVPQLAAEFVMAYMGAHELVPVGGRVRDR
jgi:DNA (cytosine-5)-methyltransferase 1